MLFRSRLCNGSVLLPVSRKWAAGPIHSRIVCADCEASFKAGDDALIELNRTHTDALHILDDQGATGALEFPNIDNGTLHRGVVTI